MTLLRENSHQLVLNKVLEYRIEDMHNKNYLGAQICINSILKKKLFSWKKKQYLGLKFV